MFWPLKADCSGFIHQKRKLVLRLLKRKKKVASTGTSTTTDDFFYNFPMKQFAFPTFISQNWFSFKHPYEKPIKHNAKTSGQEISLEKGYALDDDWPWIKPSDPWSRPLPNQFPFNVPSNSVYNMYNPTPLPSFVQNPPSLFIFIKRLFCFLSCPFQSFSFPFLFMSFHSLFISFFLSISWIYSY